jgi:hypothetical protein
MLSRERAQKKTPLGLTDTSPRAHEDLRIKEDQEDGQLIEWISDLISRHGDLVPRL